MKYSYDGKRPRNDIRLKRVGKKCPQCNSLFFHNSIMSVSKCNSCGYVKPLEEK